MRHSGGLLSISKRAKEQLCIFSFRAGTVVKMIVRGGDHCRTWLDGLAGLLSFHLVGATTCRVVTCCHMCVLVHCRGRLAELQQQERELLEVRSIPLRTYLMQHVIPTLTEGLIEVCKLKPEDPVDYLAEWLFKNNPVEEDHFES